MSCTFIEVLSIFYYKFVEKFRCILCLHLQAKALEGSDWSKWYRLESLAEFNELTWDSWDVKIQIVWANESVKAMKSGQVKGEGHICVNSGNRGQSFQRLVQSGEKSSLSKLLIFRVLYGLIYMLSLKVLHFSVMLIFSLC